MGRKKTPPFNTTSKKDAETWNRIIQELYKSQKIEAFCENIKVATFYHKNESYNKISNDLLKCKAVRDVKKRWCKATESWNAPPLNN